MKIRILSCAAVLLVLSACGGEAPQAVSTQSGPGGTAFGTAPPPASAADPRWQTQSEGQQPGYATAPSAPDGQSMAAYQTDPRQGGYSSAPPVAPHGRRDAMPQPSQGGQAGGANETVDFGIAPTQQLRPTQQLHGQTPTSIPGGQVIGTQQLAQLLQSGQGGVLLLHVYGGPEHLPGAVPAGPAAQGGSFDDDVQQGFGQFLQQATGGDTSRTIVTYCGGVECWSSYNAALRAVKLGYRNVAWYRGGIAAWQQAGLPLGRADGQGSSSSPQPQPQPSPQQPSQQPQW